MAVTRPHDPVNDGNLAGVLHSALRSDLELSPADARSKILAKFSTIKTRAVAMQYASAVRDKLRAAQPSAKGASLTDILAAMERPVFISYSRG